jgi:replication initiation protein RepC
MAIQEDSAHRAPRGSSAHSPTGFRRMTPGLLKADRTAEKFSGFPKGVEAHGQLLGAFKAAAPRLGISPRLVHAVDYLFCHTKPQDWQPNSRPIVWPSAELQELTLGLSPTQVKEINRCLIELGLVTMKDSPNGKRYGKRDPKGQIIEAFGFDLSLFAVRHAEFVRLAEEQAAERRAIKKLRRRRTIAHKGIIQILETAREYGFKADEWQTLARESTDLVRALKAVERPDEMETGVTSLERRWQAARDRIEFLLGTVDTDPMEPENRPHIYNYNPTSYLQEDTVIAANGCSGIGEASPSKALAPVPQATNVRSEVAQRSARTDKGMVHGIAADELPRLAPKLGQYLQRPDPTWPELHDAADWLRGELEVSKSLWGEACVSMGRDVATIALAIVSTKDPDYFKTSPGGYFHGMVAKHLAGELHLERTVWKLRRAIDPERYAGQERSRQPHAFDA